MIVVLRDPVERIVSGWFRYPGFGRIPLEPRETGRVRAIEAPGASPTYVDIGRFGFFHRQPSHHPEHLPAEEPPPADRRKAGNGATGIPRPRASGR